jgi:hypothetical protein
MKGRHDLSRIVVLSVCVVLLLSLAEVVEHEPFGLHLDSDGKRVLLSESDVELDNIQLPEPVSVMTRSLLDEGPFIATVAMLPCSSLRRSGPVDAGSLSLGPDEAGHGSSTVLRI